jgi:hypothetical protein
MMTLAEVLRRAFRETRGGIPIVAALYLVNLSFASVVALSFRGFAAGLGNAGSLGPLLRGPDISLVYDFLNTHGDGIRALSQAALFMTLLSAVVNAVASGGILSALGDGEDFTIRAVLAGCATFAFRFLRMLLMTVVMIAVAALAVILVAGPLISSLTSGSTSEDPGLELTLAAAAAAGILVVLLVMASDYARVIAVLTDSRSMVRAFGGSLAFLGRNAGGALALQALLGLAEICLLAVFLFLSGLLEMNSLWQVFFVFVLQQAFVLSRTFLRVLILACELIFMRSRTAAWG